uniref:Myb/SANT-like domain-containing protein n=1 Tax=Ananas comosus var. bracteatus TaxID=296719 RepID=A0A6V7Q713_ANACO|nr:unnamed protein product [Ananas comosus var. bracteatus]
MSIQQNFEANEKQGTKNFKWTNEMSDFLIEFLVHQASIGMKVDKSFKRPAFVAAARAMSSKFQVSCNWTKVENRLRTFKTKWSRITQLKSLNGASWDPVSKTISLGEGSYQDFIRAHPKDICYLNCPIQHYDELVIICGDDQATGEFASDDPNNINLDEEDNNDDVTKSGIGTTSKAKKQKHSDSEFLLLVEKIGELADSMKDAKIMHEKEIWSSIKSCNIPEHVGIAAYEYFLRNKIAGKFFVVRSPEMRVEW